MVSPNSDDNPNALLNVVVCIYAFVTTCMTLMMAAIPILLFAIPAANIMKSRRRQCVAMSAVLGAVLALILAGILFII